MNAQEAAKVLTFLAALDGREVDAMQARAWAMVLDDVPYDAAMDAVHDLYRTSNRFVIDAKAIAEWWEGAKGRRARDIRSAKQRGLVPADWDEHRPLPHAAEQRLRELQAVQWAEWNDKPEDISPPGTPIDVGVSLKQIEDTDE